jgi:hydroxyacylglutathione hydrolase
MRLWLVHAVTRPTPPFLACDGALEVHQIPVEFDDNLVWLLVCTKTRATAIVDGPANPDPILSYVASQNLELGAIFNTHTHVDHVGINRELLDRRLRVVGPRPVADDVPGLTESVDEGDTIHLGKAEGRVLRTEGHIDGHMSFVFGDLLLCGDTMFTGGCGYLFSGPPAKMHDSLNRLAALDGRTRVCCAHEYTQDNLRFAWMVEPDNPDLIARIRRVWAIRAEGGSAVPSSIAEERATNPFLRTSPTIVETLHRRGARAETPLEIFTSLRALKDSKAHRQIPDSALPL